MARTGRPRKTGKVYRFEIYYRLVPGEDPPELAELLEDIIAAKGRKRRDIIRAALLGGARQGRQTAAHSEDSESSALLDDMFAGF